MPGTDASDETRWTASLLALTTAVWLLAIRLPFHNDDAALYGLIAKQMVETGDWIHLVVDGEPWLDKPHFHFWLHAIFIYLLGTSEWVFRLPLLLSVVGTCLYLWELVPADNDKRYRRRVLCLLLTTMYLPLIIMEGRVEPVAMLALVAGIYHSLAWKKAQSLRQATLVGLWLAVGMLSKGLFVPLLTVGIIFLWVLRRGEWRVYLHWHLCLALLVFFALLIPEILALRSQFGGDLLVPKYGNHPVSAIEWFFWESQFGRFSAGRDNSGSTGYWHYYLHTALWVAFPLGLLMWSSLVKRLAGGRKVLDSLPAIGLVLFLVPFSMSSFQLPHYLVVVLPLIAWLVTESRMPAWLVQLSASLSLIVAFLVLLGVSWYGLWPATWMWYALGFVVLSYLLLKVETARGVAVHYIAGLTVQLCLLGAVLPSLIAMQGEKEVAHFLNHYPAQLPVSLHGHASHRLDYYLEQAISHKAVDNGIPDHLSQGRLHLFARLDSAALKHLASQFEVLYHRDHIDGETDLSVLWSKEERKRNTYFFAVARQLQ